MSIPVNKPRPQVYKHTTDTHTYKHNPRMLLKTVPRNIQFSFVSFRETKSETANAMRYVDIGTVVLYWSHTHPSWSGL